MHRLIRRLCGVVLAGALAVPAGTTLAPAIAHAETAKPAPANYTPLPDRGPRGTRAGIPSFGIPYASERANGKFFLGTVDLDGFELKSRQILARGRVLSTGRPPIRTSFKVKIKEATCDQFTLELGPPPVLGLRDPLLLEQSVEGGSELRRSDFCAIAGALADRNLAEVVSQLNDEDEVAAGLLGPAPGACVWYEAVGCAAYTLACGAICVVAGPACLSCFAEMAVQLIQEAALCGRCLRP